MPNRESLFDLFSYARSGPGRLDRLSPAEVEQIIRRLNAEGCSILLVEQNLAFAARLASRVCILNKGAVVYEGNADAVMRDPTARQYLGVDSSSANRNQEIAAMSGGERNYHV